MKPWYPTGTWLYKYRHVPSLATGMTIFLFIAALLYAICYLSMVAFIDLFNSCSHPCLQCYVSNKNCNYWNAYIALFSNTVLLLKINYQFGCRTPSEVVFLYEILLVFVNWGYSSVAEHSTADREVAGSTPAAPFLCFTFYITKCYISIS